MSESVPRQAREACTADASGSQKRRKYNPLTESERVRLVNLVATVPRDNTGRVRWLYIQEHYFREHSWQSLRGMHRRFQERQKKQDQTREVCDEEKPASVFVGQAPQTVATESTETEDRRLLELAQELADPDARTDTSVRSNVSVATQAVRSDVRVSTHTVSTQTNDSPSSQDRNPPCQSISTQTVWSQSNASVATQTVRSEFTHSVSTQTDGSQSSQDSNLEATQAQLKVRGEQLKRAQDEIGTLKAEKKKQEHVLEELQRINGILRNKNAVTEETLQRNMKHFQKQVEDAEIKLKAQAAEHVAVEQKLREDLRVTKREMVDARHFQQALRLMATVDTTLGKISQNFCQREKKSDIVHWVSREVPSMGSFPHQFAQYYSMRNALVHDNQSNICVETLCREADHTARVAARALDWLMAHQIVRK
jgi:hypothetical protein